AYGVVGRTEEVLPHFFHEPRRGRPAWAERIAQLRSEWFDHLTREASVTSPSEASDRRTAPQGIHPATVVATPTQSRPEEAIIALDVGEHVLWFARHFRGNGRQDILVSGYWRTMGF